jgi:hypothetical protein
MNPPTTHEYINLLSFRPVRIFSISDKNQNPIHLAGPVKTAKKKLLLGYQKHG